GKGVQSVAAVAQEVVDLRRLVSDEHVEATVRDDRTDRMDARTAVLPDRRQIAEPDAELVDEGPPGLRHLRLLGCELAPALHPGFPSYHPPPAPPPSLDPLAPPPP